MNRQVQPAQARRSIGPDTGERGRLVADLGVVVAILLLGTLALSRAWAGLVAWPLLLLAALLGLGVLWFVRRVGVVFPLALLVAAVVPPIALILLGRGEGHGPLASVTDSLPVLLTSPYPAPVAGALLGPGLVVAWVAGAILGFGIESIWFRLHPLAATLLLMVCAELLTAGDADRFGLIAAGMVVVLFFHWARSVALGRAVPVVLAALAVLTVLLSNLPVGTPFQPRDLVEPPTAHLDEPNPLPMLNYWARNPDIEILRRSGDSAPLRLVVLPDYDGVSFGSRSTYEPYGVPHPPVLPPGRFQVTLDADVTWSTTTRWLPTPGQPVGLTLPEGIADPVVDVDNGSMLLRELPPDGFISYAVTGRVDAARLTEVEGADVATEPRYLVLPALPPEFVGYAREVTEGSTSYLQMAQAIEQAVASGRSFDAEAPGGSSLGRLSSFLFTPRERGGRTGTSEQFATAYALLARSVGLPTRVVVGFGDGEPLPDDPGTRVVRGRDALAWPEVYFTGYGWVAFDPTPNPDGSQAPRSGRVAPPAARPDQTETPPPPPPSQAADPRETSAGRWAWPLLVLALAGPIAGLAIARRRRVQAQREQGAIGAWLRVEDAMVLAGIPPDRTRSAAERAATLGVPPAVALATHAEAAAFA
ncbi:MAG TPA: transglutaminase domain-containing protein, partial [Propionibacterium sp.]|nr:transglutaminase domain-containing protein [Propionibacterium sp.]